MMLDVLSPGNEIWLASAYNTHCKKLTVCSKIRVGKFSVEDDPKQL